MLILYNTVELINIYGRGHKLTTKATLLCSDLHYGDAGQYLQSLRATMSKAINLVAGADEIEIISNGDAAAGRGIFRDQGMQNSVQLGSDQVLFCAADFYDWVSKLGTQTDVSIIIGNHDFTNKENLAVQLTMILQLLGIGSRYYSRNKVANLAPRGAEPYLLDVRHGFGASSYYANNASSLVDAMRTHIVESRTTGQVIRRFARGHTHWLNVGQVIALDVELDTTGGWHRQERMNLGMDPRVTGVVVYLHDGKDLDIIPVQAPLELLLEENNDIALHYKNLGEASKALNRMAMWAKGRGLA